jgi:glucose-1-phosphate thymidylyltransferase
LIIAGDNLFEFSLKEFAESHKKHNKSAVALYDVKNKELAKLYGIVGVNKENKMIEFEEKPKEPKSTLASTGIYIYPPHILPMLQEFVKKYKNSDKAGNFLEWLHKKEHVYCYITKEKWFDIGTLDQLEKAKKEFKP